MSEEKSTKKEPKAKKPLNPLSGAGAAQYEGFKAALKLVIDKLGTTTEVPAGHLREAFAPLSTQFREALKKRKGDPIAAKRARIAEKIAKLQAQLSAK